jgi:ABC-2 type transport system permease protein
MLNLLLHEIRVRRGAILGWTIGLGFFAIMYMSFFPALPDELLDLPVEEVEIYQAMGIQSMSTFEGYILSTVFNFFPLLVGIFGVVLGVGALAGEEENGTMELLASLPLSRLELVLAKAAALALVGLVVMLLVGVGVMGVLSLIQDQIPTAVTAIDLFYAILINCLILFVLITLSLFLGAYLPNPRTALSDSVALLIFTFFANNLAGLVPSLEAFQPLLPFYYFDQTVRIFVGETAWSEALVLLAMAAGFLVLTCIGFQKRNITVEHGPGSVQKPPRRKYPTCKTPKQGLFLLFPGSRVRSVGNPLAPAPAALPDSPDDLVTYVPRGCATLPHSCIYFNLILIP